jgi:hypothetical protein
MNKELVAYQPLEGLNYGPMCFPIGVEPSELVYPQGHRNEHIGDGHRIGDRRDLTARLTVSDDGLEEIA